MENSENSFLESFLPHSYLSQNIKTALLLQLVAPEPISILLLGDPTSGKTSILKAMVQLPEKARYCEGIRHLPPSAPSIWLRDTFTDLQLLCFNKLDRASPEDQQILEELISSGIAVLAAVNPKFGRFDPDDDIYLQIDLPPTLINRFDLIFPLLDRPNRERDEEIASFILTTPDPEKAAVSTESLKKSIWQVRQTAPPQMTEAAIEELKQYYVARRNPSDDDYEKCLPITAKQLVTLAKLSKAAARLRQSDSISCHDAQKAIGLMDYCLSQMTGTIKEIQRI